MRKASTLRKGSDASGLTQAHQRLEHLYEISQLFARFESAEQTFYRVLEVATKTLHLRTAILMATDAGISKMIVWPPKVHPAFDARHVRTATEHLKSLGTSTSERDVRFVAIPLAVAHRTPFGTLQVESVEALDGAANTFIGAIATQLAVALDRDRAWQMDITRREHAEDGQFDAEARSAMAERDRVRAESTSDKYELLARDNAKLYKEAQRAVRVREQILAIVTHDLRNPLSAILLTAETLSQKGTSSEAVGRIQRAAIRMRRLIEDLLDFASIEAGSLAIRRQPQDPAALISESLANFEGVAQERELTLTADVELNLPKVYCDRDRILQVLSNLVGNATKVIPKGGRVTVRVAAREQELLFSVVDDGPGISEADQVHLFDRYWRSDEADYKGTGLGLAIAKGIVEANGGRLWVQSAPGDGATFWFSVPEADMTSLFAPPSLPPRPHPLP